MVTFSLQILFIIGFPFLARYASLKTKFFGWLSPIVTCYVIGMLVGNLPFVEINRNLMMTTAEICVSLAIPLLLFSSDFMKWLKHSKSSFISFFIACLAVIISSSIAYLIYHNQFRDTWKMAGMMIGLYTGSTANMTAIGMALNVKEEVFVVMNSVDIMISGLYFLFLITFARAVYGRVLPKFKSFTGDNSRQADISDKTEGRLPFKKRAVDLSISLGLSIIIFAVAFGSSRLFFGKTMASYIILVITTLGILVSFYAPVRNLKSSYNTGDYLLLVFAVSIGSLADLSELSVANMSIVVFFILGVFGSAFIHLILARLFKIDTDTMIITSAAAIYGPAFVVPVAEGIKNREVIVSGLAMALLGNAIGNYVGIGAAYLLRMI
jgi:uncharacterized membrane protein